MTLWSGRVARDVAPAVWDFLRADDAELLPYDCRGDARPCASPARRRAPVRRGARRGRDGARLDRRRGESSPTTRTSTRRSSGCSATVGRKIHAGRSRNDQVAAALRLYVADACLEAVTRDPRLRGVRARPRRGGGRDADARLHAPAARPAGDGRPPPAGLGRDARARPRPLPASPRTQARPSPLGAGALAGSTLELPPPPRRSCGTRSTRSRDRDFALDYLYACAVLALASLADRRGARPLVDVRVRLRPAARGGGDRVVDDAAEAEPRRGRAGARQGRHGHRAAHRLARDGQGAAARVQPRPAGGQGAGVRGAARCWPARSAHSSVLVGGIEFDHERLAAACSDPLVAATDAAEALGRRGHPVPRRA